MSLRIKLYLIVKNVTPNKQTNTISKKSATKREQEEISPIENFIQRIFSQQSWPTMAKMIQTPKNFYQPRQGRE